jgi:hypothetical protein
MLGRRLRNAIPEPVIAVEAAPLLAAKRTSGANCPRFTSSAEPAASAEAKVIVKEIRRNDCTF